MTMAEIPIVVVSIFDSFRRGFSGCEDDWTDGVERVVDVGMVGTGVGSSSSTVYLC